MLLQHLPIWFAIINILLVGTQGRSNPTKFNLEEEAFSQNLFQRRLADNLCQCGVQLESNGKPISPWTLYVHLDINSTESRTCVGTVISSNLILTSHLCGLKEGKQATSDLHGVYQKADGFVDVSDLIITDHIKKGEGSVEYKVTRIFANPHYIAALWEGVPVPTSDAMAIVVDHDFTQRDSTHKPICLPFNDEVAGKGIVGQSATFESTEGHTLHNLKIQPGKQCAKNGSLKFCEADKSDIFCVTLTHKFVTMEVGQPLYIYLNMNPYAPATYTFLVGVSALIEQVDEEKANVYFVHINSVLKQLDCLPDAHPNTTWCTQPWPWRKAPDKIERDESLDCGDDTDKCGLPRLQPTASGYIPNGNEAIPYEFPWMAKVDPSKLSGGEYRNGICGGSLINDRIVLTAAHCVVSHDLMLQVNTGYEVQGHRNKYKVFLHSHKRINDSREIELAVRLAVIHPGYVDGERRERAAEQDLALLILEKPLDFSAVGEDGQFLYRPVCLPTWQRKVDVVGKEAIIAGWGLASKVRRNSSLADVLQKRKVVIEPLQVCKDLFKNYANMTYNSVICGGVVHNKNANIGDSGGPVAVIDANGRHIQIGAVSYALSQYNTRNEKIAQANFFADVQELLPWVDYYSNMFKAKYCKNVD